MTARLDLFEVLKRISLKDAEYYSNLSPEDQKQVLPVLLQRWLTGTTSQQQLILVNEVVNPFVFTLYKHPQLLWYLMTAVTTGKSNRYKWPAQKSKAEGNKPTAVLIVQEYYRYSSAHANDAVKVLSCDQVIELAHSLGYQQDTVSKIKKEFNVNGAKSNKQ